MTLAEHREGLNTVKQQRRILDDAFAKAIADGTREGYSISDLLDALRTDAAQPGFDL